MVEIPEGVWTRLLEIERSYGLVHKGKADSSALAMEEVHQGIFGHQMNGRMLAKKILRIGYCWNTMETDCVDFVKSGHDCQTHANLKPLLRPPSGNRSTRQLIRIHGLARDPLSLIYLMHLSPPSSYSNKASRKPGLV